MSCLGFLSSGQRAALAVSSAGDDGGQPLSSFASPPVSEAKRARVARLATSTDARIRESAALSYAATADVLSRLAGDAEPGVRRCVARNPHAPASVLWALATDEDPLVRGWVAAHPGAAGAICALLSEDPDPVVAAVVAWAAKW